MSKNRHQGNGTATVAKPAQEVVVAPPKAVVPVEEVEVEETTSGEQLALQLINSLDGDMRLTIASAAFSSGQKRLKRLKADWNRQIEELKSDWADDDAELLKLAIQAQRATILQLFVSMNPAAFASRAMRDRLAETVDKLIESTVSKIVAPKDEPPNS